TTEINLTEAPAIRANSSPHSRASAPRRVAWGAAHRPAPSCGSLATASTTVCATLLADVRDRTRIRARISGGLHRRTRNRARISGGLHRRTRNRARNGAAVGGIVPSHGLSQLGSRQLGEFRSRLSSATCPACDRVERPPDSCQG